MGAAVSLCIIYLRKTQRLLKCLENKAELIKPQNCGFQPVLLPARSLEHNVFQLALPTEMNW